MKTSFSRSIISICFKALIGRRDYLALVLHFLILYFINMIFFISHRNSIQHKLTQKLHLAQTTALSPHHLHSIREALLFLVHSFLTLFTCFPWLWTFSFFFFLIKVKVWKELKYLFYSSDKRDYDYLFGSLYLQCNIHLNAKPFLYNGRKV